jgi:hypothetical protein
VYTADFFGSSIEHLPDAADVTDALIDTTRAVAGTTPRRRGPPTVVLRSDPIAATY